MAGLEGLFPGFTSYGLVSDQVREIATVFNAEGVEALSQVPEKLVQWAEIGTRVTKMVLGQGKIPVKLTALGAFEEFTGERTYTPLAVSANSVKVNPWQKNFEWPVQFGQDGAPNGLQEFYGVQGLAGDVVQLARQHKARMVASVLINGMTNSTLSMTAQALTLPQPGYASGLPLFSDGSTSGGSKHYSNPLDPNSATFSNLHLGAGKITAQDVMGTVLTDMVNVPHPTIKDMTMGLEVTDLIGPPSMLIPFWQLAMQTLALQTTTSPGNLAAATTNVFTPEMMAKATGMIGAVGITPWRFWIAPQLAAHPYVVANPTKQMWFSISRTVSSGAWCEMGAPNTEFVPRVTLLGEGSEECIKSRKVRMLTDLDAGAAAGLPHFIHAYFETTPGS